MTDNGFVRFFLACYKIDVVPSGASSLNAFIQLLTGLWSLPLSSLFPFRVSCADAVVCFSLEPGVLDLQHVCTALLSRYVRLLRCQAVAQVSALKSN